MTSLSVGYEVPNTDAEGPGRRYAIWVQGCPLRCDDCCNPELLSFRDSANTSVAAMLGRITSTPGIEGISLLGGEPFAHAAGCAALAEEVRALGLSVMVFSGFTLRALQCRGDGDTDRLLAACDLLVDGPYRKNQPDTSRRWIGSRNQQLHFLSSRYRPDAPQFFAEETVEFRLSRDGTLTANGWPKRLPMFVRPDAKTART